MATCKGVVFLRAGRGCFGVAKTSGLHICKPQAGAKAYARFHAPPPKFPQTPCFFCKL